MIESRAIPEPNSGCLLWLGAIDGSGYPVMRHHGRVRRVARLLCEGIEDDQYACHRCDVPICVNAEHIYAGTPKQNTADALRRGRMTIPVLTRANHGRAALTEDDLLVIAADPRSSAELAPVYGVDPSTIRKARRAVARRRKKKGK